MGLYKEFDEFIFSATNIYAGIRTSVEIQKFSEMISAIVARKHKGYRPKKVRTVLRRYTIRFDRIVLRHHVKGWPCMWPKDARIIRFYFTAIPRRFQGVFLGISLGISSPYETPDYNTDGS